MNDGRVICDDCLTAMRAMDPASVDTIITDPPYGLTANKQGGSGQASLNEESPAGRSRIGTGGGFMGKKWDAVLPGVEVWGEALRVAKPGAFLIAFGGTRTVHRLACAIEDAGWEIRDRMMWVYGSGFPKSLDISKAIDKAAGAEREVIGPSPYKASDEAEARTQGKCQSGRTVHADITAPATEAARRWDGYGTALKPAWEPIIVAMKPTDGTFAENALDHGVAGLWIDGGRIAGNVPTTGQGTSDSIYGGGKGLHPADMGTQEFTPAAGGRWPANFILSHHPDCQRRGVRKVKSDGHAPAEQKTRSRFFGQVTLGPKDEKYFGGAGGTETVEAWDCHPECPVRMLDEQSGELAACGGPQTTSAGLPIENQVYGKGWTRTQTAIWGQSGGASRFFYTAKASRSEREAGLKGRIACIKCGELNTDTHDGPNGKPQKCVRNGHPTVKPVAIMRYLARLTKTPGGGLVLDPFCGSGTTAVACEIEGRPWICIDSDPTSAELTSARAQWAAGTVALPLFQSAPSAKSGDEPLTLFKNHNPKGPKR